MYGGENMIDENFISDKIANLRIARNISARDMSLSLGQSQNYINNIENKKSLPSMQMFLYICEFFRITPKEFFDEGTPDPCSVSKALEALKPLKKEQLNLLIAVAKEMK